MGRIEDKNISQSFNDDYAAYKLAVNRKRAVPKMYDGCKEVLRRILTVMVNDKSICMTKYIKSQMIVGETMGKYHPHGDSSIYGAMASSTQWFNSYMPLFETESNFGTFVGDGPAAARYTEIKMTKFCKDYIVGDMIGKDGNKNIVDWRTTYSGMDMEPEFFAPKIPILLINGTEGIGVGEKYDIPPHNINEVIDATLALIDNPNIDVVLIPDQIMPCDIDKADWKTIAHTGSGNFKVRGHIIIQEYKGSYDKDNKKTTFNKKYEGLQTVVIKSLPNGVTLDSVTDKVEELIASGELPQVIDSLSDSDVRDPNHVFVIKKGADPEYVRSIIYKKTNMIKTQLVNFKAIVKETEDPVRFSHKSYLQAWIIFAVDTKRRLQYNLLQKVKTAIHEKEAFIKALQSGKINEIINKIRKRKEVDDNELIEWLIKAIDITDLQAQYIINANIKYLSVGYLNKFIEEAKELRARENEYILNITDESRLIQMVREDLLRCKAEYGFKRRCKVVDLSGDDIPEGDFKIVLTDNNYIKKLDVNEPIGNCNGKVKFVLSSASNKESILLFNSQGRVFKLPIHNVPISSKKDAGYDLRLLVKKNTSPIIKVIYEPLLVELSKKVVKHYLTVLSERNLIKKVALDDFLTVVPSGVIYTKLKDDDEVKDVQITPDTLDVIIYSDKTALRCQMTDIPEYKKNTLGVNAIANTDKVDGMAVLYNGVTDVIVITESGRINKIDVSALPRSERYRAGNKVIKLDGNDKIKYIFGADSSDILHIERAVNPPIDIPVANIKYGSSISTGNKMIPLKGDSITKAKVSKN